jgi:hypothetical protein
MTNEPPNQMILQMQMQMQMERRDIDDNILQKYLGQAILLDTISTINSNEAIACKLEDFSRNFVHLTDLKEMENGFLYLIDDPYTYYNPKNPLKIIAPSLTICKRNIENIIGWNEFLVLYEEGKKKIEGDDSV